MIVSVGLNEVRKLNFFANLKVVDMGVSRNINSIIARAYVRFVMNRPMESKCHHLLVACMPKSGSTFLSTVLGNLPGMQVVSLVPGFDRREQELDISLLHAMHSLNYVAQQHIRYSLPTEKMLRHFGIKPIVLVRNLFDVVMSIRDHFRNESIEGSMAYVVPEMKDWEDPQLERFIVQMMIPWYFNFYMSWMSCESKHLVRYEDLVQSPESVVADICDRMSLSASQESIEQAIKISEHSPIRKNQGIAGRGEKLDEENKRLIRAMASFYKGVDFSPIGISG